ncbi:MAG: cytochrome P450 [Acidobacteriaceae bacterium]|nr:cytochrome P450 [Acidobacteriaceae bacterium]
MAQPLPIPASDSKPPGPPGNFLTGNFPELRDDALGFLTRCAREYGDIVRYRMVTFYGYLLNHPDYVDEVLVTNSKNFVKGRGLRANRALFGEGLLTSEGEVWLEKRRTAQPSFHSRRIDEYGHMILPYVTAALSSWREGTERDIAADMMSITMQVAAKAFFGADVGDQIPAFQLAFDEISRQNAGRTRLFHLPDRIPTPANIRYNRAVHTLESVIYQIIRSRHAQPQDNGDLLSMLLQAHDQAGGRVSEQQLRDDAMTFLLAGHETTALTLSWAWYLLAQNPQAETTLVEELDRVLKGRLPGVQDLSHLPYTEAIIKETMRLYPPAWLMVRQAVNDCRIGQYRVPAGSSVVFSQWVLHRDPRYFEAPLAFRPERWLDGLEKRLPRFAYFPFGGGPRMCIGAPFALMEAGLVLAAIASQFHFDLLPCPVVPMPAITLRPKFGIKVRVSKRQLTNSLRTN